MTANPFVVPYAQLPKTLPIFPLPGAIVMPGNELPLNIFEPRYLNMVNDALSTHRMIGMIQPAPDRRDESALSRSGCAGRINQYRETNDGRIEIMLSGVCRYDVRQELSTTRGYRLIVPEWSRFSDDYADREDELHGQHEFLIRTLRRYFDIHKVDVDWNVLERLSTLKLMNSLTMALPLSDQDKQLLLETIEPADRLYAFTTLLGGELGASGSVTRH